MKEALEFTLYALICFVIGEHAMTTLLAAVSVIIGVIMTGYAGLSWFVLIGTLCGAE